MSKENCTFRMLYVIGIIMVVTSHSGGGGICLCTDWFPENSFHMQLFFFASGYFYLKENEENIGNYIKKKMRRFVFPLFLYNIFYGLFCAVIRNAGFSIGVPLSIYSIFVSSFVFGSDFGFNSPDWFIAQLFIVEVLNIVLSKICPKNKKNREYSIILIELLLGMIAVVLVVGMDFPVGLVILGRSLYSLSWYGIGRLYRILEKYDTMSNGKYLSLLIGIQFVVLLITSGKVHLTYMSVVKFNFDGLHVWGIYFIPLIGIAFWLRICKLLSYYCLKYKIIIFIGKHTFSIVENQYLGFWILNTVYYCLYTMTNNILGFDCEAYMTKANYFFKLADCNQTKILYVVFGLGIPMIISYLWERVTTQGQNIVKKIKCDR